MKRLYLLVSAILSFTEIHAQEDQRKALFHIQKEIDQLQEEVHRLRLKSIAEELKGNEYMRTEWDKYVDQIEKSENTDVQLMQLEKKLESLQFKKRDLLIQYKLDQRTSDDK